MAAAGMTIRLRARLGVCLPCGTATLEIGFPLVFIPLFPHAWI
jgi:hypothetical protein